MNSDKSWIEKLFSKQLNKEFSLGRPPRSVSYDTKIFSSSEMKGFWYLGDLTTETEMLRYEELFDI